MSTAAVASAAVPSSTALPVAATVSDRAVRAFVDQGFHVGEGLVSPAELAELKADLLKLARGGYPTPSLKPLPPELDDQAALENILCIHQPHYISPVMRRFAEHPAICRVLSRITAAHLPHWDGAVKCMQTMLFVKAPGKQGQAWHQDERYIPTRDRSLIGAWIAIDDATVENGCLWVIPGSHRNGYLFPTKAHGEPHEYDNADMAHGFDLSQAVPVEVKAGSVVFFNGYLLHKSLKNRSQIYRRALVSHYMNGWSLLPWHQVETTQGKTSVGLADSRCVFPVAGVDPYAWKGYETPANEVFLRSYTPTPTA
jgi:hypothetical protein